MRCFHGWTEITQHCLTACSAMLKVESISLVCLDFIGIYSSPNDLSDVCLRRPIAGPALNLGSTTVHMGSSHTLLRLTARGWKCCPAGPVSGSDDSCVGTDCGSQKLRRVGTGRHHLAVAGCCGNEAARG